MKKIILLLLFVMSAGFLLADDLVIAQGVTPAAQEKTIIVYDPIKHTETASNIFMTWAGISLGSGIIAASNSEPIAKGIGTGNIVYGAVETALAIINLNWGEKITDPEKARLKMIEDSGWHAWSGLGHLVSGMLFIVLGNTMNMNGALVDFKGVGVSLALQGAFISMTNTMNYSIAKDPKNIRDWNAGVELRFPLLSSAF